MKSALRVICLLGFVLVSPLLLFAFSIQTSGMSAVQIKTQLSNEKIYAKLVASLTTAIDEAVKKGQTDNPLLVIGPMLKREVTPAYVQKKMEPVIDETAAWAAGGGREPVLSFGDLKERMVRQYPDVWNALQTISQEMKKQAQQAPQTGQTSEFNLDQLMASDFVIPLGKPLGPVKFWAGLAHNLPILFVVAAGFLAGVVFLAQTRASKLRSVGTTFILAGLWNVAPVVVFASASWIISILGRQAAKEIPAFVFPLVEILLRPLLATYVVIGGVALIFFFSAGMTCFFVSGRGSQKSAT